MSLNNWIKYIKERYSHKCTACGRLIDEGFSSEWHEARCIDKTVGYELCNEKITPETRVYFMKAKK